MSPGNAEASSSSYPFYFDPAAATSSQYRLAVDPTLARDVKPSLDPSLSSFAPPSSNIAYSAPPIGGTRCYWSILSPALDFVFIDPVLHRHLGEDSSKFLGTSLLDYVHPDEVANLRTDLVGDPVTGAGGVASGGVFGSTSRVRYSRISRIRKLFGGDAPYVGTGADYWAYDSDYLEIQVVTSWIGGASGKGKAKEGGAVLAFFHATQDIDARQDNNEHLRSHWTNWCGPSANDGLYLDPARSQHLLAALTEVTGSRPLSSPGLFEPGDEDDVAGPPPYVFQILDHTGAAIVSFPSPNGPGAKRYDANEYSKLVREVIAKPRGDIGAKTSCTKRYRAKHPMMKNGTLTTIESTVILYGAITFASFQTGGVYLSSTSPKPPPTLARNFELEDVPTTGPLTTAERVVNASDQPPSAKRARPNRFIQPNLQPNGLPSHPPLSIATSIPTHYTPRVDGDHSSTNGDLSPTVASASAILGSFNSTTAQHNHDPAYDSGFYALQNAPPYASLAHPLHQTQFAYDLGLPQQQQLHSIPFQQSHGQQPQHHQPAPYTELPARLPPPQVRSTQSYPESEGTSSPVAAVVPAPRLKQTRVKRDSTVAPKSCESCGTVNSPEWRKGPGGVKTLCNACGLRYARLVARKTKAEQGDDPNAPLPTSAPPSRRKKQASQSSLAAAKAAASNALAQQQPPGPPSRPSSSSSHPSPIPELQAQQYRPTGSPLPYDLASYNPPPRSYSPYHPQQPLPTTAPQVGQPAPYTFPPAKPSSFAANGSGDAGEPVSRVEWTFPQGGEPPRQGVQGGEEQQRPWMDAWRSQPYGVNGGEGGGGGGLQG